MDVRATLAYIFGNLILRAGSSGAREKSGKYGLSIFGAGVLIPTRIVLWKVFGFKVRVKQHRRGFHEGEMDILYKGKEYFLEYDDFECISIETEDREAFEILKAAIKKSNFNRLNPHLW